MTTATQRRLGPTREQAARRPAFAERRQQLAETQLLLTFQRAVSDVAPSLHRPHDLDVLLQRVCELCRELFDVDEVCLWHREGECLIARGASGTLARDLLQLRLPLAGAPAPVAQPLCDREPAYVNRVRGSDPQCAAMVDRLAPRSWMSIPLRTDEEHVGTIVLAHRTDPEHFSDEVAEWAKIFAAQATLAIQNARLRERERAEARTTAMLLALAEKLHAHLSDPALRTILAEESARMLESDLATIVAWQEDTQTFRVTHLHGLGDDERAEIEGLELSPQTAEVFTRDILRFDRAGAAPVVRVLMARWGIEHLLYLPIRREQALLGILVFARRADRAYTEETAGLAKRLGYHAATALENARLVDALQVANRLKSEFVATMSHELRSPLNVIMGYTDLLRDGQFGPVTCQQAETLGCVLQQSQRLLDLINNTLDISRLERGDVAVSRQEFSLADLFAELEAEIWPRLSQGAPSLFWHPPDAVPRLYTDRGKLKLVVRNLVDNGLKFTERGSVEVAANHSGGRVDITVRDTGRGIAKEALPTIFDMFRQVDSGDTRCYGGVGLGLYVVRRLVTLLGGTVEVESTPSAGSTFRVSIPAPSGRGV